MNKGVLKNKAFHFAIDIVALYKYLTNEKKEYVLSKQLLLCGTSIGANIYEGQYAQSKEDFISKHSIALKEANESRYWIELMVKSGYLDSDRVTAILDELIELIRLLVATLNTAKEEKR